MNVLVFDTETTGLFDDKLPLNHPDQPYIVQLGALLADEDGNTISELNVIIEPDNWSVPNNAAEVHGIPTETAEKFGIPIGTALTTFMKMCEKAEYIVGHNVKYDIDMLRRYSRTPKSIFLDDKKYIIFDTMRAMTNISKLPLTEKQVAAKARYPHLPIGDYKSPTLTEAHKSLFDEEFDSAHSAMADVEACKRVFFELYKKRLLSDGVLFL